MLDKYGGKVTKKGSAAENCAKGCVDMDGGKIKDHGLYCPGIPAGSRIDQCMDECDYASQDGNKKRIKECKYGCGYWSNTTQLPIVV